MLAPLQRLIDTDNYENPKDWGIEIESHYLIYADFHDLRDVAWIISSRPLTLLGIPYHWEKIILKNFSCFRMTFQLVKISSHKVASTSTKEQEE